MINLFIVVYLFNSPVEVIDVSRYRQPDTGAPFTAMDCALAAERVESVYRSYDMLGVVSTIIGHDVVAEDVHASCVTGDKPERVPYGEALSEE